MRFARRFLTLATAAILLAVSANATIQSPALVQNVATALKESIQGAYIIKLRAGNEARAFVAEHRSFAPESEIQHTYELEQFQGFAGKLTDDQLARYRRDPRIEYVQPQRIVTILGQQNSPPSWGLSRISQRKLDADVSYVYPDTAGKGIDIWVVDTGVVANHSEF
jgi:hypothetical protein